MIVAVLVACTPNGLGPIDVVPGELVTSTVALRWNTAEPGHSWVEFGLDALDRSAQAKSTSSLHEVRIAGLKPGRTYRWQAFTDIDGRVRRSSVGTLEVAEAPASLPRLEQPIATPDAVMSEGYVLTSLIEGFGSDEGGGWVIVVDADGDIVWWFDTGHHDSSPPDLAGRVPDGWAGRSLPLSSAFDQATHSFTFSAYDLDQRIDVATFRRVPVDALTVDEVVTTRLPNGHHDFVYLPAPAEGDPATVGYIAYDYRTLEGDRWASDALVEIQEGSQSAIGIRPVWTWLDDGPAQPTVLHAAQEVGGLNGAEFEWTHSNSLMLPDGSNSYFLMSKFLDCLVKIDRSNGRAEWILGGPYSDFALPAGDPVWSLPEGGDPESALWSQAHMSDLWYDPASGTGGFVVFDNGSYRSTPIAGRTSWSRIAAYGFDEGSRTVEQTWDYVPAPPQAGPPAYTTLLGDADDLGDTWLTSWSNLRNPHPSGLQEIDDAGEVLWHVRPRAPMIVGRAEYLPTLSAP